jgi:hypothetical protein
LRRTVLIVQVQQIDGVGKSIALFLFVECPSEIVFECNVDDVNYTIELGVDGSMI